MNKFMMNVSSLVEEEYRTTMFHHDVDISRLMVYVQQIAESKLMKMNRDGKRDRSGEPSQTKSKNMFYSQDSAMEKKDRISNKKSQGGSGGGYTYERPKCTT